MKYRPNPDRTIEAHRIVRAGPENFDPPIPDWLVTAISNGIVTRDSATGGTFTVETMHGPVSADVGDWLVQEPDLQHVYPVKPEIFAVRYVKVEP